VRVAIGEPGRDLVGFLNTRRQADAARRVGRYLAEPVVRYADVALVHVLLADPRAAQSFARNELGRLARPEHADLRRTVLTYLEAGPTPGTLDGAGGSPSGEQHRPLTRIRD
jgi:hypothetical protein